MSSLESDLVAFTYLNADDVLKIACYETIDRTEPAAAVPAPKLEYRSIRVSKHPERPYYRLNADRSELIVDFFVPILAPKHNPTPTPFFSFSINPRDSILRVWGGLKFVNVQLNKYLSYPISLQGLAQRLDYQKTLLTDASVSYKIRSHKEPAKMSFKCGAVVVMTDVRMQTIDVWNARLVISMRPGGPYAHDFAAKPEPDFTDRSDLQLVMTPDPGDVE